VQLKLKSSFLDRERAFIIDPDFIEFDDKDLIAEKPTRIVKEEINAFRYGIKWISGYQFTIGRIYCIDIKSTNDIIIRIRLKSLYGVNKKKLSDKYAAIVNALYDQYFDNISLSYLNRLDKEESSQMLNIFFTPSGILLDKQTSIIAWDDLGIRSFTTYFAIFRKSTPEVYRAFEYLTDWNAGILYSILKQILINKGL
jgi:hypothetical protein